uniref:Uncharacterized protein n=1 Tax=Arundo donax TaxID=35708 RepID=A0A0A8YSU5_ARUDO
MNSKVDKHLICNNTEVTVHIPSSAHNLFTGCVTKQLHVSLTTHAH